MAKEEMEQRYGKDDYDDDLAGERLPLNNYSEHRPPPKTKDGSVGDDADNSIGELGDADDDDDDVDAVDGDGDGVDGDAAASSKRRPQKQQQRGKVQQKSRGKK